MSSQSAFPDPNLEPKASPESRGKRLKLLRKMANLTRSDIEETYQISASTLRSWEEGRQGLTEQGAKRIMIVLRDRGIQCSVGWLLYGTGSEPRFTGALYQDFSTTIAASSNPASEEANIQAELDFFCERNNDAISMLVDDDGMEPHYKKYDYVAGIKHYAEEIDDLIGQDCIVETQKGITYLRQLRKGARRGCYTLICTNLQTTLSDPVLYNIELSTAAPIIWHRRRSKPKDF